MTLRRAKPFWAKKKSGAVYEPEYQAVLDRASFLGYTTPDLLTNIRNNERVKNLKLTGIWDLLDLLYIFDQPSGCGDFAKLNYLSPSNFELFNSIPADEPSFIADSGFKGNGSTMYFDTGFNVLNDTVNFDGPGRSESLFFKGFDFIVDSLTEAICGVRVANDNTQIYVAKANSTTFFDRVTIALPATNFNNLLLNTHILISKFSASSRIYSNGVYSGFNGTGNNANNFVNRTLKIFVVDFNGTVGAFSKSGLSYFGIGSNLGLSVPNTSAENLYNIMNDTYTP